MSGLNQAIKNFTECNGEYKELQQQNQRCSKNSDSYYERKDNLASQVLNMEQKREQLVDKVALGDADPAELSVINEELKRLKEEQSEAEELYEAAERGQKASAEKMRGLISGSLNRHKEIVWSQVAEIEIEEAKKSAIPQIRRAFIAQRRSGRGAKFLDFLKEAFGTIYFEERYWGDTEKDMEQAIIENHQLPFDR